MSLSRISMPTVYVCYEGGRASIDINEEIKTIGNVRISTNSGVMMKALNPGIVNVKMFRGF